MDGSNDLERGTEQNSKGKRDATEMLPYYILYGDGDVGSNLRWTGERGR